MTRVVLIYPKPNRIQFDTTRTINLGLAYMAAVLEQRGHSVALHDSNLEPDSVLIKKLRDAELVAIYTITAALKAVHVLASRIKNEWNIDCKIILGGPHPTSVPNDSATGFPGTGFPQGRGSPPLRPQRPPRRRSPSPWRSSRRA